jgi:hypothetical protein
MYKSAFTCHVGLCVYYGRAQFFLFKPHLIYNMHLYIQQIGVRIGYYGLGRGTL